MPHFLFEREELIYNFVKEVNADLNSPDFDQRALQQDGIHYDDARDTAVVVADSRQEAEGFISNNSDTATN